MQRLVARRPASEAEPHPVRLDRSIEHVAGLRERFQIEGRVREEPRDWPVTALNAKTGAAT